MLYVQSNSFRHVTNLNGIWEFKTVDDGYVPLEKAENTCPMPLPASMNDVVTDSSIRDYVGKVLYETEFSIPVCAKKVYRLRIGATSHKCDIFLNGKKIGVGITGYLPIDLSLTHLCERNRLSIIIDNRLDRHTLPMGRIEEGNRIYWSDITGRHAFYGDEDSFPSQRQVINHDFFNYTGIHRDVLVYSLPENHIDDIIIDTVADGEYDKIRVKTVTNCTQVSYTVKDERGIIVAESDTNTFRITNPILWEPGKPYLYTLAVRTESDYYEEQFGIRKITYDEKGLYVNDKPVYFKGFGMHEDFILLGKADNAAINIRNFELLKWIHANSFRTSHYPYSEEILRLADRYGFMVISEAPAVGCNFWSENTFGANGADIARRELHKEILSQMIARDKNHPCIVMMSLANEAATYEEAARDYFKYLVDYTRTQTKLPLIIVEETKVAENNYVADLFDFIGLNRYYGWYDEIGNLAAIEPLLRHDVECYYNKFRKPIIITEFGADTIEGLHTLPPTSFSEDYQEEYLAENCRVFDSISYIIGEHVWNFADFMTKQGTLRVRGNRKGIFTRDRQPKKAAYWLRERWRNKNNK